MKKNFFVIISVVLFQHISFAQQFNYKTYPSYDSIINTLRSQYRVKNVEGRYYQLARKPDGWYVLENNYSVNTGASVKEWLYWSGADDSYHSLPLAKENDSDWVPLGYEEDEENFLIHPYWGYENWSKDVIQVFEHKRLNDSLTYALGRAYSNEAFNYLLHENKEYFSTTDIEGFISNDKKAIAYFHKTMQLNPRFETKVGNIFTKYSDEYVSAYYTLTISGLKEEAKQFLTDSLYDSFMLSTAKNFLMSCPENAILITSGDNDTYPLIYLQEKMGYRKDVIICNYTLLGIPRFIHYFMNDKKVAMTIPEKLYDRIDSGIVSIDSLTEGEPLEAAIKNVSDITKWTDGKFPYIQSNSIFFSYSAFDKISQKNMLHVVALPFSKKILFPADMALLDVLFTNGISANICFSASCDSNIFKPYRHYLQVRGLVYEFTGTSFRNLDVQSPVPAVNITETYSLLQKNFDYHFDAIDTTNRDILIDNYKYLFIECITALMVEENNSKAADLVKQYMQLFPASSYQYGSMEILLAERLIKLDDAENLNTICRELINEGNKFLVSLKAQAHPKKGDELINWLFISNEVKNINTAVIDKDLTDKASVLYSSLLRYYK